MEIAKPERNAITQELLENGFVLTKPLLSSAEARELRESFNNDELFRSTIDMQRYNFGKGVYRYFKYPLPELVQSLREDFYARLAPTANAWAERLKLDTTYPRAAVIFTSNFHPQRGARGYYRSVFKHGVGCVEHGERYTIGLVFHDYRE